MSRVIREVQPRYVVGENVPGLVNWNGGMVFDEVQADLENAGYEVIPFILPACGVNAPHRRERIWFIAHRNNAGISGSCIQRTTTNSYKFNGNISGFRTGEVSQFKKAGIFKNNATNTSNTGLQWRQDNGSIGINRTESNKQPARFFRTDWKDFPTQSPVCNGDDGISSRLDRITFSKWRNESIKAGGNAIVPQVAYQIFKAINEYDIIYQKKQYKQ